MGAKWGQALEADVFDKIGTALSWVVTFGGNVNASPGVPKIEARHVHHIPQPEKPVEVSPRRMH